MINPTGTQYPHEIQWIWIRIWISTYGYEYGYKFLFVAFLLTESNYSTQLKSDLLSSLHACRFDALAYVEYRNTDVWFWWWSHVTTRKSSALVVLFDCSTTELGSMGTWGLVPLVSAEQFKSVTLYLLIRTLSFPLLMLLLYLVFFATTVTR
jgi:hypothetical protein